MKSENGVTTQKPALPVPASQPMPLAPAGVYAEHVWKGEPPKMNTQPRTNVADSDASSATIASDVDITDSEDEMAYIAPVHEAGC